MRRIAHLAFFLFAFTALTRSASAQSVNVDFDTSANFANYKTYAWGTGTPVQNPLVDQRIIAAIDAALAAKGMQKVDAGASPDLDVLYHGAVSSETQVNTMSTGGWGYRWGGSGIATTTIERIPIGTLTVDIGDARTKKLLWLGVASDTLSDKADKNTKKINKAVSKMFKKFPPPVKK